MKKQTTEQAKFPDVDLEHPWTKNYRIPLISDYRMVNYFVVLQVPSAQIPDGRSIIMVPTEDEAKVISSYIGFRISNFGITEWAQNNIRQRTLDFDDFVNTVALQKWSNETWAYSMATWTLHGPKPFMEEKKYANIVDLLDSIEYDWSTDSVSLAWAEWKDNHGIVNT